MFDQQSFDRFQVSGVRSGQVSGVKFQVFRQRRTADRRAASLIKKRYFGNEFSYERRLWPEKRPVWSRKQLCNYSSVVFGLWERFLTAITLIIVAGLRRAPLDVLGAWACRTAVESKPLQPTI